MVFVYGSLMETVAISANDADDGTLVDSTAGFQDCGSATQEVKIDEKAIKFTKDSVAANMTSVTMNLCVQSIMTSGNNGIIAYTDANSVTETDTTTTSTLDVGDNEEAILQATVDQIATTFYTVRQISEGSKNKMGELEIEYTIPLIDIDITSRDDDDDVVASVGVVLFRRTGSFPYTYTQVDSATTNGSGLHTFSYEDDSEFYRIFYLKESSPDEWDMSDEVQGA